MTNVFERALKPAAVLMAGAGFTPVLMAQQASAGACSLSLSYAPVLAQIPAGASPVPTLTVLSLGILSAAVGVVAWSKSSSSGKKLLSVAMLGAALGLSGYGGKGLVQEVNAAGGYTFSNAQGGVVADPAIAYASPAPVLTINNTTGVTVKIVSNVNSAETGTCVVGAEIAAGASCTAAAVCVAPPLVMLTEETAPTVGCDMTTERIPLFDYTYPNSLRFTGYAYTPVIGDPPVFQPNVPISSVIFSYKPTAATWAHQIPNDFNTLNWLDVMAGEATVTANAPAGYGFGPELAPSKTWSIPYTQCGDSAIAM